MSLRIIVKTNQIRSWIEERKGRPARRRNSDDDPTVLFDGDNKSATADKTEYETLSVDEFVEAMKANHLVLLVDQEPDKAFFKFIRHN
jgi:hypothetical protein